MFWEYEFGEFGIWKRARAIGILGIHVSSFRQFKYPDKGRLINYRSGSGNYHTIFLTIDKNVVK